MDLTGLVLEAPDEHGMCRVLGARTQEAANAAKDLPHLLPGTQVRRGVLYLPANVRSIQCTPLPCYEVQGLQVRQYQREGAAFLHAAPLGAICADDVGLGKVVEVCLVLQHATELRPFVIVAPLAAMGAWVGPEADPEKYFGLRVVALRTTTPEAFLQQIESTDRPAGYFVNYQILYAWLPWLTLVFSPRCVVVDESHEVRNVRARQSKLVRKLCRLHAVKKRFFLTATPVVNRLMDLYHQLDCVQPKLWGHYVPFNTRITTSFGTRYAAGHHDGYGWDVDGQSNVEELRWRLANVLLRRTRAQVRGELPPLDRQAYAVDPAALDPVAWQEYVDEAGIAVRLARAHQLRGAELTRLTRMASSLSWAKRDIAVQRGLEMARNAETRKLLVMCWYQRTVKYLAASFKSRGLITYGPILGDTDTRHRVDWAEGFRDLRVPDGIAAVLVATIGTAAQSLNPLAAASSLLMSDLYWVPTVLIQAEGRLHREGQRARRVLIRYLKVPGTIDDIMFATLKRKAAAITTTTDDVEIENLVEALGGHGEEDSLGALAEKLCQLDESALHLT